MTVHRMAVIAALAVAFASAGIPAVAEEKPWQGEPSLPAKLPQEITLSTKVDGTASGMPTCFDYFVARVGLRFSFPE
jgi:hypothetical protein